MYSLIIKVYLVFAGLQIIQLALAQKYSYIDDYLNRLKREPQFLHKCGQRIRKSVDIMRVVGGFPAEQGSWPWAAFLKIFVNEEDFLMCGGSLISKNHIVTAAHCLNDAKKVTAYLGQINITNEEALEVSVANIFVHPKHDRFLQNDVGILKLAQDIEFTDILHPICLPSLEELKNQSFENEQAILIGWGSLSSGETESDLLQEVELKILDAATCKKHYSNDYINDKFICAGDESRSGCNGDSGGPLMYVKNSTYYLIGLDAGGVDCGATGAPELFTRVTTHLDFITAIMKI